MLTTIITTVHDKRSAELKYTLLHKATIDPSGIPMTSAAVPAS